MQNRVNRMHHSVLSGAVTGARQKKKRRGISCSNRKWRF
jgi:hypothetical protein